jgi:serine protease Do
MVNRKSTVFYVLLLVIAGVMAGMVLASRLDLSPASSAQTVSAPPMNSAPITGSVGASTFRDIAKAVSPAVVNIRTESRARTRELEEFFGGGGADLFERFFGGPAPGAPGAPRGTGGSRPREQVVQAAGTGFIIDKSGFILTNNHVVEGASKIAVSLYGEDEDQEYDAKVIGRDPLTDSALIQLTEMPNHTLPEVKFGDSAQMQPGDWVMAIGNPFGFAHTVSVGVISALDRPFSMTEGRSAQVLQTDAAINPGNSGGPLLNVRGEVIGINTAIYTDMRQGNIGIGFAIPSNSVRELLPQLRVGKITRGRIGVGVEPVRREEIDEFGLKERMGAVVTQVYAGAAGEKAGIEIGDVIVAFNGKPIRNHDELVAMVVASKPGSTVPVRIIRNRKEQTLSVTVEELDLERESTLARGGRQQGDPEPDPETSRGFGMTLDEVTPELQRRLRLDSARGAVITDVEQGSPAQRGRLQPGDVIVRVGSTPVNSVTDAVRELGRVPSGGTAFLRVLRQQQGGAVEVFVRVTKE